MTHHRMLIFVFLFALVAMGQDDCSTETKETAEGGADAGKKAKLGDPLTLEGFEVKMKVKPLRVIDPLPVGQFDTPTQKGARFVGVDVEIRNVGDANYSDSPSNGAVLLYAGNRQATSTFVSSGPCGSSFSSSANVAPGSVQRGCIPFEVPGGKPVRIFQFGLDSGFGPQTGQWTVR